MIKNNFLSINDWNKINNTINEKINEKINHYDFQNNIVNKIYYNENFNIEMNKKINSKIIKIQNNHIQNLKEFFINDKETSKLMNKLIYDYQQNYEFENKIQIKKFKQHLINESYFTLKYILKESELFKNLINELEKDLINKLNKKINFYQYSFYSLTFLNLVCIIFLNLNLNFINYSWFKR